MTVMAFQGVASAQPDATLDAMLTVEPDPDDCITAPGLRARVRKWLGSDAALPELEVSVDPAAEPLAIAIRRGGNVVARRRFEVLPEACKDRIDAVALAIALALEHVMRPAAAAPGPDAGDGDATDAAAPAPDKAAAPAEATQPAQASAEGPAADASAGTAEPAASPDALEDDAGSGVEVHLAATGLLGVLPDPVFAFGAGGELRRGRFRVGLTLLGTPQQTRPLGRGDTDTQLFAVRAQGCALWPASAFELETCAGAAGGAAFAKGRGFDENLNATMAWIAPLLRAGVRYPQAGAVSLRIGVEAMVNLLRPRLALAGRSNAAETAGPIAGAAGVDLLIAIP